MESLDLSRKLELTIMVATLTYALMFTYLFRYFFLKRGKKQIERRQEFFGALIQGLKTDSVATVDDVVNIYKGVIGLGAEDLDYRYGLSKSLRELLVEVISKRIDESLGDEKIREWKVKITEFIQRIETISPYADLPATERNLLSDISLFIEKNDLESVKRKTIELAGMIQARNDDLNKIRSINKWAIPLAVIGLVLTFLFGILALLK